MILENIAATLMAMLLALSSQAGMSNSTSIGNTPRASAQITGSVSTSSGNQNSWINWGRAKPIVRSIDPKSGDEGTLVTLTGRRFGEESVVRFGKGVIEDTTVSDNGRTLTFVVPDTMERYCPPYRTCALVTYDVVPGQYSVRVQDGTKISNAVRFKVTKADNTPLAIEEIKGPVSLVPGEAGTWTVDVSSESEGNLTYSVKWGDETPSILRLFSVDDKAVQSSSTFTHTYDDEGTFEPVFTVTDEEGHSVTMTAKPVVVSDGIEVPHLDSVTPNPARAQSKVTLVGSGFTDASIVTVGTTSASNVDVKSTAKLIFTVPHLKHDTYDVTVSDKNGTSNPMKLTVTEPEGKVTITGIEAPNSLQVGENGTWVVHADSTMIGNLTYSVDWGEGTSLMRSMLDQKVMTQSSSTFTHAYDGEGAYKPTFTVTDEGGHTASVSASVIVTSTE